MTSSQQSDSRQSDPVLNLVQDESSTPSRHHHRSIVSYVQRGERMTSGQQQAWDRYWPTLGRDLAGLAEGPLDVSAWFGRQAPLYLEIGSGMGETTAQLAAAQPEVNYLAVEVYKPGLAQLLLRIEQQQLTNLRLIRADAVTVLTEHLLPDSLTEVRIFFPDPWQKKRHHKRRLVQADFVRLIATRLVPGGRLHLATDWESYADQMLEVCTGQPLLINKYDQWAPRPQWRPVTKFEQRAIKDGRIVRDIIFERKPLPEIDR